MVKIDEFKRVRTHKATVTMYYASIERSKKRTEIEIVFGIKIGRYMETHGERKVVIDIERKLVLDRIGAKQTLRKLAELEVMLNYINIEGYEFKIVDYTKRREGIDFSED